MVLVRLLLVALLPLLANCQPLPPQCDPAKFAMPTIVSFLGPARSVKVGASPPLPLPLWAGVPLAGTGCTCTLCLASRHDTRSRQAAHKTRC